MRGQNLAAGGDADRSRGLSREPIEQSGLRVVGGKADRRYRNSAQGAMDARDAGRISAPEQPPGMAGNARAGYRRDDGVFLLLPRARRHSADFRDVLRPAHDDQLHSHRRPGAGASARLAAGGGQVHQRLSEQGGRIRKSAEQQSDLEGPHAGRRICAARRSAGSGRHRAR